MTENIQNVKEKSKEFEKVVNSFPIREIKSSLPLQIALHYHIHLDPFIYISLIGCLIIKYEILHPTYRVILVALLIISVFIEIVRPYLGYYGNLGEKIPALSGFWITTLILQIPISLFLVINPEIYPLPLERFLLIFHLLFLFFEAIFSFQLVRTLAEYQIERFKSNIAAEDEDQQKQDEAEIILHKMFPEATDLDITTLPKHLTDSIVHRVKDHHKH
uniref:Transmembrane protein 17 n=1 Tax=Panagrolaimus superbus TaxID=310955 RepID=A0A914Z033_9BILA